MGADGDDFMPEYNAWTHTTEASKGQKRKRASFEKPKQNARVTLVGTTSRSHKMYVVIDENTTDPLGPKQVRVRPVGKYKGDKKQAEFSAEVVSLTTVKEPSRRRLLN